MFKAILVMAFSATISTNVNSRKIILMSLMKLILKFAEKTKNA